MVVLECRKKLFHLRGAEARRKTLCTVFPRSAWEHVLVTNYFAFLSVSAPQRFKLLILQRYSRLNQLANTLHGDDIEAINLVTFSWCIGFWNNRLFEAVFRSLT